MEYSNLSQTVLPKNNRVTLGVVAIFLIVILFQTFWQTPTATLTKLKDKLDLSGQWETCILGEGRVSSASGILTFEERSISEQCSWSLTPVPGAISTVGLGSERGWVVYRKRLSLPKFCTDTSPCSFIAAEVGDAALIAVNQKGIGIHGGLPPEEKYARHYPLEVSIPSSTLQDNDQNELWVIVRHMKKAQTGILRGPVAIVPTYKAFLLSRSALIQNVLLPLMSAVGVSFMALLCFLALILGQGKNPKTWAYFRYCIASCLFLASYTSLPREVLPLSMMGCLHFLFRFLMDFMFFELAISITGWKEVIRPWIRTVYIFALSVFIFQFTLDGIVPTSIQGWMGFSGAVRYSKLIDYFLIFGAYFYGALAAIQNRKYLSDALSVTFGLTALTALAGCLTFHGVANLPYFVMIYPFFVALIVGIEIALETLESNEKMRRDAVVGHVTRQIVHNLKSPLTSLCRHIELSHELPPKRMKLMRELCIRMDDMINGIIPGAEKFLAKFESKHTRFKAPAVISEVAHLGSLLDVVVSSKRIVVRSGTEIDLDLSEGFSLFSKLSPIEFTQVITNILDNAVDATEGKKEGRVEVSIRTDGQNVLISVEDNGCGIDGHHLKMIGEKGFTFGKPKGTGLGLHYSIGVIRALGGRLQIESKVNFGTKMEVVLPLEPTPKWFADRIVVSQNARGVILDDDPGIREIWKVRLSEAGIESVILNSGENAKRFLESDAKSQDLLLFDHELLGEDLTGLDLLEKLQCQNLAGTYATRYLVTSYFNEPTLISRCESMGIKMIPKSAIHLIDFEMELVTEGNPGLKTQIIDLDALEREAESYSLA